MAGEAAALREELSALQESSAGATEQIAMLQASLSKLELLLGGLTRTASGGGFRGVRA